uniref:OsmC-like protein n=1 Tax=Palpitomonas bilix TaxID=652834 RepID=A0A7S3DI83_9EUKA|mmetsp:Transcript_38639/g.99207  ORF Transcript_38639/g.99207 Transcript_38639/m.99207 type:complete len:167 (+) Transcript_38639:108-608(+)|eukprot:CAMPEP_0113896030 /NCGR_PEP_ID=MMETSP0780_2-20120614/17736_1 /TAXON_ID=652834 /ORGANISM="Palpitomonas bilix" /LENGTH=166 /DNA_ID=CAMNT_0000887015 /DNA_START=33 /DNA_END=533 /DNA_ORIENTATION=+ /assembly_acc=CAM_ASM_000599
MALRQILKSTPSVFGRCYATTALKEVKVSSTAAGVRSVVKSGKHEFIVDEPVALGGTDQGASPLGYFIGSVVACEQVTAEFVARKMGHKFESATFEAKAYFDPKGFAGVEGHYPRFQKLVITADVTTTASQEELDVICQKVQKQCIVADQFHASGCDMDVKYTKIN